MYSDAIFFTFTYLSYKIRESISMSPKTIFPHFPLTNANHLSKAILAQEEETDGKYAYMYFVSL